MIRGGVTHYACLSGFDALQSEARKHTPSIDLDDEIIESFSSSRPHAGHLNNLAYDKYLRIHKVLVRNGGAKLLGELADAMSDEVLPDFLDAAGWAYAESALSDNTLSAVEKIERLALAEENWRKALVAVDSLRGSVLGDLIISDSQPFRLALNLSYAPLMKAIAVGSVTSTVRYKAYADTLAIAQLAIVHQNLARRDGVSEGVADMTGLVYECTALLALLSIDDPRYIPMPSSPRADSGYYHRDQTHDITILNQHWGDIRKIIPVEIKKHPSGKDRLRYRALIISKNDLVSHKHSNAEATIGSFTNVAEGSESQADLDLIDQISSRLKTLLRDYQQGFTPEEISVDSVTKFYTVYRKKVPSKTM